jgi:tRNA (cytidine32/uridine32-2'-O)-methyltransferase
MRSPPIPADDTALTAACRERLRFVLVGTQHPGNIGSSARALHTMGLSQLWLVAPGRFPDPEADALAAGAGAVLAMARVVPTLDAALADCRVVYGCSARGRHVALPELSPREAAAQLAAATADGPVALVFGPERTGLDNRDLQRCHTAVRIPANPEYPSLNLAAAVQVLAYEVRMAALHGALPLLAPTAALSPSAAPAAEGGVTQAEMEALFAHFEATLTAIDFHKGRPPGVVMGKLRRLLFRARPEPRELRLLRGILADVERIARLAGMPPDP